jgi:hypothetical protein
LGGSTEQKRTEEDPWVVVVDILLSLRMGDFRVRPDDSRCTADEVLAIIEYWKSRRDRMDATDPVAVLHDRIKRHIHGAKVSLGWPCKRRQGKLVVGGDGEPMQ